MKGQDIVPFTFDVGESEYDLHDLLSEYQQCQDTVVGEVCVLVRRRVGTTCTHECPVRDFAADFSEALRMIDAVFVRAFLCLC